MANNLRPKIDTTTSSKTMFPEAIERAKFLDKYLIDNGKPLGPLHGLPISVKDGFNIKGVPSTLGYILFQSYPVPEENSPVIDILLSLGAIIHVKTNVPQTMMDTLWWTVFVRKKGRTRDPWQHDSAAIAMPYKNIARKTSLRLGFIAEDPAHPVAPPIARALETAFQRLAAAGHEVVKMSEFPSPAEAANLCWSFYLTDPQNTTSKIIEQGGEPKVPAISLTWENPKLPNVDMDEYYNINTKRRELKAEWHKMFVEQKFDAVMLPAYMDTAPAHDKYGTVCYTAFANLLDVISGSGDSVRSRESRKGPTKPYCSELKALFYLLRTLML
ncbi:putative Acetamidase [Glarea lozoyensis 74030]|uniref:Putative Acetamidase n=1 Tax=Glarea lozoyensis (strain ATCC 74030 / MF5533) TaxID=1104152 RepID=H0EJT4_GLAL7|nr:putative Acetamidase [Glarea lozoyensis 74030]